MLDEVTRLAVDALGCDTSSIFVLDEEAKAFHLEANTGATPAVLQMLRCMQFPMGSMPLGQVLKRGAIVEEGPYR